MDNRLISIKESSGKNTKYTYAVGRIRVLETRLLKRPVFDRMAEQVTYEDSLRVLSESSNYRQFIDSLKDKTDFESIFVQELKQLYSLVSELSLHKGITDIFLLKYDLDNLRALIQAKLTGYVERAEFIELGIFKIDILKECLNKNDFRILGEEVENFALEILKSKPTARDLEVAFSKFYITLLKDALVKTKSPFLLHISRVMTDLLNIKILIRANRFLLKENLEIDFLGGGYLGEDFLRALLSKETPVLTNEFSRTAYNELVKKLLGQKEMSFKNLDVLIDDYLMNIIKEAKFFNFGIEPLIGYIFAKEYEVRHLRKILAGKIYNVENEFIKNSSEEVYV